MANINKKASILWLLGGVFLIILLAIAGFLFFRRNLSQEKQTGFSPQIKELREQADIQEEYRGNLNKLIEKTTAWSGDAAGLVDMVENSFFDIYVPNKLRDQHVAALLTVREVKSSEDLGEISELKERLKNILQDLLTDLDKL